VLDPFMGSGSTLVAASRTGRRYVGYDLDAGYVELARARVDDEGDPITYDEARMAGSKERCAEVLTAAGFTPDGSSGRLKGSGMTVHEVVIDDVGGRWAVELGGPFVRWRGGLTSADAVWRTLGRAHALRGVGERVLVLTSELPRRRTELDIALRAAGPAAMFDVIDVFDDDALARLTAYAKGGETPLPGFWNPDEISV